MKFDEKLYLLSEYFYRKDNILPKESENEIEMLKNTIVDEIEKNITSLNGNGVVTLEFRESRYGSCDGKFAAISKLISLGEFDKFLDDYCLKEVGSNVCMADPKFGPRYFRLKWNYAKYFESCLSESYQKRLVK